VRKSIFLPKNSRLKAFLSRRYVLLISFLHEKDNYSCCNICTDTFHSLFPNEGTHRRYCWVRTLKKGTLFLSQKVASFPMSWRSRNNSSSHLTVWVGQLSHRVITILQNLTKHSLLVKINNKIKELMSLKIKNYNKSENNSWNCQLAFLYIEMQTNINILFYFFLEISKWHFAHKEVKIWWCPAISRKAGNITGYGKENNDHIIHGFT
jgi:hypothetical protein